jgi:hypothetical protein
MKIRWKTAQWKTARWKTAQLTAAWIVRTPANAFSSPSMAQSSIYMVLSAVELVRSLLAPPPPTWAAPMLPKISTYVQPLPEIYI